MSDTKVTVASSILGFLGGNVTGWFVNAFFAARRDRRVRQLAFIEFIHKWRSDIERADAGKIEDIWAAYCANVGEFHGRLAKVKQDFRGKDFRAASKALGEIRFENVASATGDPRDVICAHLDTLKRVCQ